MWKKFVSGYLTFTKRDRNGLLVLVTLMGITLFAPLAFPYLKKEKKVDDAKTRETIKQLNAIFADTGQSKSQEITEMESEPGAHLFYFDPNTLSVEEWQQLGVRKNVAATIQKYISKGGRFKHAEDLRKIYTLSKADAERLIPFVRIHYSEKEVSPPHPPKYKESPQYANFPVTRKKFEVIDINTADTSAFINLPGIGSKLARRIVNFREKLGGFISIAQVGETRFLLDSTFQKIKPFLAFNSIEIKRININNSDIDVLNAHPYISYQVANAIVQYRNQNGKYEVLDDLKKIHIIDEKLFIKIKPYLTLE